MLATIDLHVHDDDHESCMRVAVRVLHSCAFIIDMESGQDAINNYNYTAS